MAHVKWLLKISITPFQEEYEQEGYLPVLGSSPEVKEHKTTQSQTVVKFVNKMIKI